MQGNPQVVQHLQAQLKNELTATNQYFLHTGSSSTGDSTGSRRRSTRNRSAR